MSGTLRHFAINADNVSRARVFYETVFGWTFTPWGPPGFYQTRDAGDGLMGALQERRDWGSRKLNAFEATFGVEDIRAALAAVTANGGRVLMEPFHIDGVGDIGYFEDCEGNICGIAQYVEGHWE
jgi:predicted enzyme related to lactoylglutathione lyase